MKKFNLLGLTVAGAAAFFVSSTQAIARPDVAVAYLFRSADSVTPSYEIDFGFEHVNHVKTIHVFLSNVGRGDALNCQFGGNQLPFSANATCSPTRWESGYECPLALSFSPMASGRFNSRFTLSCDGLPIPLTFRVRGQAR